MKKMRRLIPAIAMLLVSAVMLSTASFAWFTMNESVTATGMQIKAKASGNLLISTDPLYAAIQTITTTVKAPTSTEIIPVTYDGGWKVPADSSKVDPEYGYLDGTTLTPITYTSAGSLDYGASNYFVDYTVYVATAGDAETMKGQNLYVTLNMVSAAEDIANAYSVAFYVDANKDGVISDTEFAGYVNYEQYTGTNAGKPIYLNGEWDIPSTYGVTSDKAIGLPIIMRVFADGHLKSGEITPQVPTYVKRTGMTYAQVKAADTNGTFKYYKLVGDEYVLQDATALPDNQDMSEYYTWDGTAMEAGNKTYDVYYVNNANIPTTSTSFDITIGAKADIPADARTALPAAANNG